MNDISPTLKRDYELVMWPSCLTFGRLASVALRNLLFFILDRSNQFAHAMVELSYQHLDLGVDLVEIVQGI